MNRILLRTKDFMSNIIDGYQCIALFEPERKKLDELKTGTICTLDIECDDAATYNSSVTLCILDIKYGSNTALITGTIVDNLTANNADKQYLEAAKQLLEKGVYSKNRTATGTYKLFGTQLRFDLREGTPVLTSKKVNVQALIKELLWFCRGETNTNTLGSKIWDQWATEDGDLGPVYGAQWRFWRAFNLVDLKSKNGDSKLEFLENKGYTEIAETLDSQLVMFKKVDQLSDLMDSLRNNPNDRRMLVTAWNPAHNPDSKLLPETNAAVGMQALPPCHTIWQVGTTPMSYEERLEVYISTLIYPTPENIAEVKAASEEENTVVMNDENIPAYYLDLQLYQRSADWFIGVPFNIASYSILQQVIAHSVNMIARDFIHTFGDYHVYENHVDQLKQQFTHTQYTLPQLVIKTRHHELAEYKPEDIELVDYQHSAALTGEVAK